MENSNISCAADKVSAISSSSNSGSSSSSNSGGKNRGISHDSRLIRESGAHREEASTNQRGRTDRLATGDERHKQAASCRRQIVQTTDSTEQYLSGARPPLGAPVNQFCSNREGGEGSESVRNSNSNNNDTDNESGNSKHHRLRRYANESDDDDSEELPVKTTNNSSQRLGEGAQAAINCSHRFQAERRQQHKRRQQRLQSCEGRANQQAAPAQSTTAAARSQELIAQSAVTAAQLNTTLQRSKQNIESEPSTAAAAAAAEIITTPTTTTTEATIVRSSLCRQDELVTSESDPAFWTKLSNLSRSIIHQQQQQQQQRASVDSGHHQLLVSGGTLVKGGDSAAHNETARNAFLAPEVVGYLESKRRIISEAQQRCAGQTFALAPINVNAAAAAAVADTEGFSVKSRSNLLVSHGDQRGPPRGSEEEFITSTNMTTAKPMMLVEPTACNHNEQQQLAQANTTTSAVAAANHDEYHKQHEEAIKGKLIAQDLQEPPANSRKKQTKRRLALDSQQQQQQEQQQQQRVIKIVDLQETIKMNIKMQDQEAAAQQRLVEREQLPVGAAAAETLTRQRAARHQQQQQQQQAKAPTSTKKTAGLTTTTTTRATRTRSSSSSTAAPAGSVTSLSSCILSESSTGRSELDNYERGGGGGGGNDDVGRRAEDAEGSEEEEEEVRIKWDKKMDFLLSIIGFAVDLASIWRFPYLVYKNGGGVFLIPYLTMLVFGGIPLFFLELCLGQFVKKGPITLWNKICPYMKGVGYCSILVSWYVSFYYNVLIAWSVYFIYRSILSFGQKMPWEDCDNAWNSRDTCVSISKLKELCAQRPNETLENCRKDMFSAINVTSPASEFFVKELSQIDKSSGLEDMGSLQLELVVCTMIVYSLHYFSLFRGLETSGKVVWVTATAPYMILSILLVRGLFLPGAAMGIEYYLSPRYEKLADPQVWIDAAGQVFYSIGVGFGVHLTYASFNSHNNNCYRDCLMTSAVNALTSVYSGLVVFVYLGYMATNLGIDIDKVASEGYSLVFEVYPEALTTLPFARFWSILFFIMLFTLGLDSAMGGLEAVITGLEDEFKFAKRLPRGQLVGLVIVSSFLPALISCTQGGAYTLFWFDIYSAGVSLLFAALFETIGVVYCYGLDKFILDIESMLGKKPQLFFILCWKYISPIFLMGIIFMSIYTAEKPVYRGYTFPLWSIRLGWCLAFSSVAAVPIVAIWTLYSKGTKAMISLSPSKSPRKPGGGGGGSGGSGSSRNASSRKSTPTQGQFKSMMVVNYTGTCTSTIAGSA